MQNSKLARVVRIIVLGHPVKQNCKLGRSDIVISGMMKCGVGFSILEPNSRAIEINRNEFFLV